MEYDVPWGDGHGGWGFHYLPMLEILKIWSGNFNCFSLHIFPQDALENNLFAFSNIPAAAFPIR
jgi:hypothetical protein